MCSPFRGVTESSKIIQNVTGNVLEDLKEYNALDISSIVHACKWEHLLLKAYRRNRPATPAFSENNHVI